MPTVTSITIGVKMVSSSVKSIGPAKIASKTNAYIITNALSTEICPRFFGIVTFEADWVFGVVDAGI